MTGPGVVDDVASDERVKRAIRCNADECMIHSYSNERLADLSGDSTTTGGVLRCTARRRINADSEGRFKKQCFEYRQFNDQGLKGSGLHESNANCVR